MLTIKISPANRTTSLRIEAHAFAGLALNEKATLSIEISRYATTLVADNLAASITQAEHSTVKIYLHNMDEVIFTSNVTTHAVGTYAHNRTFSLEVSNADRVHFTTQAFRSLQITPYSMFSLAFRSVRQIGLAASSFSRLQIGDFASFSLLIEAADSVQLGEGLFKGCEQSSGSQLLIQIDQIGSQALSTDYDYGFDDAPTADYDSDEYDSGVLTKSRWFCVPKGLLDGLVQGESALVKFVLSRFESSVLVAAMAFNDVQLSDNGKLHVMFSAMKGHVIVDSQAFHLVRLNDGKWTCF